MKKYNVYIELIYIIIASLLCLIGISFVVAAILNNGYFVLVLIAALSLFFSIFVSIFSIPNAIFYIRCQKSDTVIKAKVIDKFKRNTKLKRKEDSIFIVLEYKLDGVAYKSVNLVSLKKAEAINIKDKVDVKIYKNKALMV